MAGRHLEELLKMFLRLVHHRTAGYHELHVVPGFVATAAMLRIVVSPLVEVEPADAKRAAVEHRDLLVMRGGQEVGGRPFLRSQQAAVETLHVTRQPRQVTEPAVAVFRVQTVQLIHRFLQPPPHPRPEDQPVRSTDAGGMGGGNDVDLGLPASDLGRGEKGAHRPPRVPVERGRHDRIEIRQSQMDMDAPPERMDDEVEPRVADGACFLAPEFREQVKDAVARPDFRSASRNARSIAG
jgi:hypothetical protein